MITIKRKQLVFALVIGLMVQGCAEALEKDLSKQTVRLVSPADNVIVADSSSLTFAWDSLTDAKRYRLQVVSPSFDSAVYLVADTTVRQLFYTVPQVTVPGRYQWRVMGLNNTSATAYTMRSFTIR
jgi:hypothetical protein